MCKYCDGARLSVDSDYGIVAEIEDNWRGPRLYFGTTIDGGVFGYMDVEGYIDIKYCPMCGNKLVEDGEDDEDKE